MSAPLTFEQWLHEIDLLFVARYGLGVDDVDDYCWHALFSDGLSPANAFAYWREEDRLDFESGIYVDAS